MYDEELNSLDEGIRRLKTEYEILFSGYRKKPPDDLRFRVERTLKRLSEVSDMTLPERFRYNTLIARFYVYRDMWRRTQQARESGYGKGRETVAAPAEEPRPTYNRPVEAQISIADPAAEPDKIRRFYDELLRMRGKDTKGSPGISYEQFSEYIISKTHSIKQRNQCAKVTFRFALEGNAIKFTAKAGTSASS